ncbi:MAG: HEAT repeat domain-containing protein [Bacteroidota bacterium]|nr:HEAT repeat domain-containing protein [Bacteroidota bacterium]
MTKSNYITIFLFSLFFTVLLYTAILISFSIIENRSVQPSLFQYIVHELPDKYILNTLEDQHLARHIILIALPVILISIILSLVSIITLILVIIADNTLLIYRRRLNSRLKQKIDNLLIEYLVSDSQKVFNDIKKFRTNLSKKILTNRMIQLQTNVIGDTALRLRNLFIKLHLDRFAVKRFSKLLWYKTVQNIRVLSRMDITDTKNKISGYRHSPITHIKLEAMLALINLDKENTFSFLSELTHPLPEFHQLYIYDIIIRNSIKPPLFSDYVNTKNESVVLFCLKMIGAFKQDRAYKEIIHLLNDERYEVRKQTIRTLGELENKNAIPLLKALYSNEDKDNKIEIIKSISKIEFDEPDSFFMNLINEKDLNIRMEALKALFQTGNINDEELAYIEKNNPDVEMEGILKHIMDKRI